MTGAERREYLVGVVVALVCAATLVLTAMGNRRALESGDGSYLLTANFARVDGIHVGSPVRVAGVTAGTVSKLELDGNYRAVLTLRMDRPVPLPSDTAAVIETEGVFGAKYIELQPGGEEDQMASGSRVAYTQDSVIIEDLITRIVQQAQSRAESDGAAD